MFAIRLQRFEIDDGLFQGFDFVVCLMHLGVNYIIYFVEQVGLWTMLSGVKIIARDKVIEVIKIL